MAAIDFLPATTYQPLPSGQAPRRRRSLNTIMEDDEESIRGSMIEVRMDRGRSPQKAEMFSPLSDHFPTPRGKHFMIAPICPPSASSESSSRDSISLTLSSARNSYSTDCTDFDDLYDVSSDEEARSKPSLVRRIGSGKSTKSNRLPGGPTASRAALPALVIPSSGDKWPSVASFKLLTSPVPPTPPPKVPMSPAMFQYLQSQEVPSCSAPPSLDGSLSSEQMAAMSAPPTPNVGYDSDDEGDGWGGVQLQPAAMATLQALSGGDDLFEQQTEQVIELTSVSPEIPSGREMQQALPPLITNIHRNNSITLSPEQQRSMNSLTRLDIPSPGGFFSALSPRARHTWHLVPITPASAAPPSSTTAEHFYKTPWTSAPVEQIIEFPEMEAMSDGLSTARPNLSQQNSGSFADILSPEPAAEDEIVVDEILTNFKTGYAQELQCEPAATIDRTAMWLAAQGSYHAALINPTEERDDEVALFRRSSIIQSQTESEDAPRRKTVRFSKAVETAEAAPCPLPKFGHQDSTYYRAFQKLQARSFSNDTFVHRIPRFEALQAQRVSFTTAHHAQLLGKYQLSVGTMGPTRRMSANVARGDDVPVEDLEKLKREKEYEAISQMSPATWNVMASKLLNGGRLIAAPVAKRLARLSSMGPRMDGTPRDRARILDLGGQGTCDWAWHCAMEYPNTKVYTVTTKALRQLSNSNIRGPKNHRQVAVHRLTKLPFGNNQFDLISAREIYNILRENGENGEDEWDACLKECMRVLKPGGYLEFSIMDSDIVNAGPLGLAKSREFGFNLKTLGYDPYPTKLWLARLNRAGFVGIKRGWLFLPMGAKIEDKVKNRNSLGVEVKLELEAMVTGSTDSAASVCGVVGGWAWEKWLSRCKVQTVGEEAPMDSVQDIVQEGRACGAGWRTVNGWARKPLREL